MCGEITRAALPPENACKASGLCTRSVVYLYTLCVYRYGAVSRRPGKCREAAKILLRQQQGYSPQAAEKHAQRAAPTVACLPCKGKLPKGRRVYSFCFCKKNQKAAARTCKKLPVASFCASETAETGRIANGCEQGDHVSRSRLRPATSVQIAGRYGVLDRMTGFRQVTGYVRTAFLHSLDGNDLNRC